MHQNLNNCHSAAIIEANQNNAAILFLSPDLIVSIGFFHYLVDILNQGKRLIATLGVRLSLENVEKELKAQNKLQEGSPLSITAKELTCLALKNLHSFSLNLFWKNEIANTIFPNLYWWLSDSMILARGFHIHPFVIWPTNPSIAPSLTIDGSYAGMACPDKKHWHILTDTNEIAFFELSTNNRFIHSPTAKPSLERMALWAISNVHLIHRYYITHKFYIGSGQQNANWDKIEKEAALVIDSILHPTWRLLVKSWILRIVIWMFLGFVKMIKLVFFINSPERKVMVKKTIKRILPKIVFSQMKKVQCILNGLIH